MADITSNVGDLTKPATLLIEKLAAAIGILYEPRRIVNEAKAEAQRNSILVKSEIETQQLKVQARIEMTLIEQTSLKRLLVEQRSYQDNQDSIVAKALPLLNETSNPQFIDDDWLVSFFEKGKLFKTEYMQLLWAKILAGEANKTNSFSKKTISLLADMEKQDAEDFTRLIEFSVIFENYFTPLIFNYEDILYIKNGVSFNSLSHLENLGLINFETGIGNYAQKDLSNHISIQYFDKIIKLSLDENSDQTIKLGKVMLTKAGQELATICDIQEIDGFWDMVCTHWEKYIVTN